MPGMPPVTPMEVMTSPGQDWHNNILITPTCLIRPTMLINAHSPIILVPCRHVKMLFTVVLVKLQAG